MYTYQIMNDPEPTNPREYDNLGTLALFHRRGELPNESPYLQPCRSLEELEHRIKRDNPGAVVLPVRVYQHSGIALTANPIAALRWPFDCPWDSAWAGLIYATPATIRREYGVKRISAALREQVVKCLEGEITALSHYLNGVAYGFEIYGPDGEIVDSCWGYDDYADCESEAQTITDGLNTEGK